MELYIRSIKSQSQELGLPNVGNTCFINAIVQSLYASSSFREHLRKLQSKNKITKCLQKIFVSIASFDSLDEKALLMKKFASILVQSIQDYQPYLEQDALKFFMDIISLMKEAFPSQLFLVSYEKICPNHLTSQHHQNQRIYHFSDELFMEACPQICRPCSEDSRKLVKKISYLIKVPQNLMTFGQDFISELSVHKLKIQRPYFYILYFNKDLLKQGKNIEECFSVIKYQLKSRTLYKGNLETGHYIALRKRIQFQTSQSFNYKTRKASSKYYKFDDLNVNLIEEGELTQKDKLYATKFTIYQRNEQFISIDQFQKIYKMESCETSKKYCETKEKTIKSYSLFSKDQNLIHQSGMIEPQKRNNMQQIIDLYKILIKIHSKTPSTQRDRQITLIATDNLTYKVQKLLIESEDFQKKDSDITVKSKQLLETKALAPLKTPYLHSKKNQHEKSIVSSQAISKNLFSQPNISPEDQEQSFLDDLVVCCLQICPFFQRCLGSRKKNVFDTKFYRANQIKPKYSEKKYKRGLSKEKKESIIFDKFRITLKEIFRSVRQKSFIVYHKALFRNIWRTLKENYDLDPSYREIPDIHGQSVCAIINDIPFEMKECIYFCIQYEQLPIAEGRIKYDVFFIPNEKYLKHQLYRRYVSCFSSKEEHIGNLLQHKTLNKEWEYFDEMKMIVETTDQSPQQIQSFIKLYSSNNQKYQFERLRKQIASIYEKLIKQIVRYRRQKIIVDKTL